MFWLIAAGLIGLVFVYFNMRNSLVAATQRVDASWSGISVQLKRRHDMIPSVVKAVRAAQGHERGIIDAILKTREAAISALSSGNVEQISKTEAALASGLRSFFSYAESNPAITATANIQTLQQQIENTEDQIAAARRFYNASAAEYNTAIQSMPWNYIADQMGLKSRSMIEFSADETAQINVVPDIAL